MVCKIARVIAIPSEGRSVYPDSSAPGFSGGISIGLALVNDHQPPVIAWGDVWVGGERVSDTLALIRETAAPLLAGRSVSSFSVLAQEIDRALIEAASRWQEPAAGPRRQLIASPGRLLAAALGAEIAPDTPDSLPLFAAVRCAASHALLHAAALTRGIDIAEVIAKEWGLPLPERAVDIQTRISASRMDEIKRAAAETSAPLPHIVIDDPREQVGSDCAKLTERVRAIRAVIAETRGDDDLLTLHIDARGALGSISERQPGRVLGHLYALEMAAAPYPICIEDPVITGSRAAQIGMLNRLRDYIRARGMSTRLAAGEWISSVDDAAAMIEARAAHALHLRTAALGSVMPAIEGALISRANGVGAFIDAGAATEHATRSAVHISLATGAALVLEGPDLDQRFSQANREMRSALACFSHKKETIPS